MSTVLYQNGPRLGIPGTGTTPWGEHLCVFFDTKADLLDLVVPYIKAGLEDHEFCLWVTGAETTEREALRALEAVLPSAPHYADAKQLEIVSYRDWYFTAGTFDEQKAFENWAIRAQAVKANGFTGTRTTGNPFWLLSDPDWALFLHYEQNIHRAIKSQRVISLCTYPSNHAKDHNILSTYSAHHSTLLKRDDEWQYVQIEDRKL